MGPRSSDGPAQELRLRITQNDLASMVGATRESTNKWLGYYERQGWMPGMVHTTSRIDVPAAGSTVAVRQPVEVRGVAFAGDRGISAVEVSADGGSTWSPATIRYAENATTWALWSFVWRPSATGAATLVVRATDGQGDLQSAVRRGPVPAGAQGRHEVPVRVA
jgi:hypothetical protein